MYYHSIIMTLVSNNIISYVRSDNRKKIIILTGERQSFRCRQRDNIGKQNPLKFISFKTMLKDVRNKNKKNKDGHSGILIGPINFYSLCKL